MIPLIVLLVSFVLALFGTRGIRGRYDLSLAGRIAMSLMLLVTASGHFLYPEGMRLMLPQFIPFKSGIIVLTGIMEILGAIGLVLEKTKRLAAWMLIFFFIAVLPANVYAAMHHVNYQDPTAEGPGTAYLWFRVPLQLVFIAWVYWFAIRKPSASTGL